MFALRLMIVSARCLERFVEPPTIAESDRLSVLQQMSCALVVQYAAPLVPLMQISA